MKVVLRVKAAEDFELHLCSTASCGSIRKRPPVGQWSVNIYSMPTLQCQAVQCGSGTCKAGEEVGKPYLHVLFWPETYVLDMHKKESVIAVHVVQCYVQS
jgi:hypothetical protein